jgi:hypothetical protein
MQYPKFHGSGWPIGSGMVESANKNIVEARLKGTGMHWQRKNVNPMLALRNAVCNNRWRERWQKGVLQYRKLQALQRSMRVEQRTQAALVGSNSSSQEPPPQSVVDTAQISVPAPSQPVSEAKAPPVTTPPPVPDALQPNSSHPSTRRKRWTYQKRMASSHQRSDVCPCGAPLVRLKGHQTRQYCSDRCRQRAHRQRQTHLKLISVSTRSSATLPDSSRCSVRHQRQGGTKRNTISDCAKCLSQVSGEVSVGTCICGASLVQPVGGQSRRYCSHRCRQRAYRQRQAKLSEKGSDL